MTDSSVFSVDALANALEHREQQLTTQRRQEDARKIVRIVSEEIENVAYERVYGASPQREVVANPTQSSSSGSNGSHEPQQPTAQQGEGKQRPDPVVALAVRELAEGEVSLEELKQKTQEVVAITGRDPKRVYYELAERVQELRGETDNPSASEQGDSSRVPGTGFVRNLFSRDDDR